MKRSAPGQNSIHNSDDFDALFYERMLTIGRSAIISLDANLRIMNATPSITKLIGYDREDIIGNFYTDLIADEYRMAFHNLLDKNEQIQLDYPLLDSTNSHTWVHHSGERVGHDDAATYHFLIQDISHYKQPQNQVEADRNLLTAIINNLPVAIHAVGVDGKYIFSNQAYAKLLGISHPAKLLGLSYQDVLPDTLYSRYQTQDYEVIARQHSIIHEELFYRDDGTERWLNIAKMPMFDAKGGVSGVIGIARDITGEKKSQERLANNEARHRTLLDALPDMMFVVRRDGTITEFRSSPEVQSLQVDESVIGTHITKTDFPQALIDETTLYLDIALNTQYVQSFEFGKGDNDHEEYYEARLLRLNDEEVMALLRNVTPLKRIQDELSRHIEDLTIVRQVNVELSANLNINYVVQLALDAALRLSNAQAGYLVMVQADGNLSLMSVVGQYEIQKIEQALIDRTGILPRVLKSGRPELIFDVEADEDYIPFLERTEAMMIIPLNSNERIVGALVLEARSAERFSHEGFQFLQLITGRIAAFIDNAMLHRQTQKQYEEVVYLEQLKTDMIRIASHDLKNPLGGIMGYIELLRMEVQEKLTEKERSYLDRIEVAAKKMQRITTGILSLERIQQLSEQQTKEVIDLRELVRKSVSGQMDFAVRSEQKLHRHLPDNPVAIQADPLQIHEALSNLVHNAIKYTPRHGEVTVSLTVENGIAKVCVTDTGYGIPEEMQERLFSPFYRAKTRETRFIEGTGLGLHLVKNIIERHDGKMFFDSVYGAGSTFGFDIPVISYNFEQNE